MKQTASNVTVNGNKINQSIYAELLKMIVYIIISN